MLRVRCVKNGPRVGDFYHLFDMINMPTQISYSCLRAGNIFLVKEEQVIPFYHEDIVDADTSFKQYETRKRYYTREQVRGGGNNSMSNGRPKSIGMWDISNIPVSNQYYSF